MDTEEGVEVVWNEVMFSERKNFKLQEVGAIPGQRNWLCLKQLCALQYECNLYKNCYYNEEESVYTCKKLKALTTLKVVFCARLQVGSLLVFLFPFGFKLIRQGVRLVAASSIAHVHRMPE